MSLRIGFVGSVILLAIAIDSSADCVPPTRANLKSVAQAAISQVARLEEGRSDTRKGDPAVLAHLGPVKSVNMVGGNSPAPDDRLVAEAQRCLQSTGVLSTTRELLQDSVSIIAGEQFGEIREAISRLDELGPGNIDVNTRNILALKDVNYIVYLRPVVTASRGAGRLNMEAKFSVEVVSIESGVLRTSSPSSVVNVAVFSVKLASGEASQLCGCPGPAVVGIVRPNAACESGQDQIVACQGVCPFGGVVIGAVCR